MNHPKANGNSLAPLERMVRLHETKTVLALKERVWGSLRSGADSSGQRFYENLVQDAVYNELQRLRSDPPSSQNKAAKAYWKDLNRRLSQATPSETIDLSMEVVERFGLEIHGHFSPTVYSGTTQVLPRGLGLMLNTISPRVMMGHAERALDAITTPTMGNLRHFVQELPDLDSQLIIQGEVATLQALERKGTVILVPTHVSNMDSPLVAWGIYRMQLPPFTYGAGLNLFSNPIMSFFLSHLGAYTVDRKKGAQLYKKTLKAYSQYVLEQGMHSLFFPGGTRSRSGRIEHRLKLGLLGTGLDAYIANLQHKKEHPNIYIVPCTLSYQVVLEAETLIDDHLKGLGKSRYIIMDDEFSRVERVWKFVTNLMSLDSKTFLTISKPLDPFGNRVDADGVSRDNQGRPIDISRYVMKNGYVVHDAQRDKMYTNELGDRIVESFMRDNVILSAHVVCYAIFMLMEKAFQSIDFFKLLRLNWHEHPLKYSDVLETIDKILLVVRNWDEKGKLRTGTALKTSCPHEAMDLTMRVLNGYHTKAPIIIEGKHVIPADSQLILYYSNRLRGYGLSSMLGHTSRGETNA